MKINNYYVDLQVVKNLFYFQQINSFSQRLSLTLHLAVSPVVNSPGDFCYFGMTSCAALLYTHRFFILAHVKLYHFCYFFFVKMKKIVNTKAT